MLKYLSLVLSSIHDVSCFLSKTLVQLIAHLIPQNNSSCNFCRYFTSALKRLKKETMSKRQYFLECSIKELLMLSQTEMFQESFQNSRFLFLWSNTLLTRNTFFLTNEMPLRTWFQDKILVNKEVQLCF